MRTSRNDVRILFSIWNRILELEGKDHMERLTEESVRALLPVRKPDANKGDFGRLLCITGSRRMPGAAALSAMGALRAHMLEAMYLPLQTDADGFLLDVSNRELLLPHMERADAVLLGCGLGLTEQTRTLVRFVLQHATCPVILDADGLNAVASCIDIGQNAGTDRILTPHPGEMARILHTTPAAIQADREACLNDFCKRYPQIVLALKGAGTLIGQGTRVVKNETGNPGMSRGGSGDVLAGILAALVAQKLSAFDAACAAVYIHGAAGDLAAQHCSMQAMLPSDLIHAMQELFLRWNR